MNRSFGFHALVVGIVCGLSIYVLMNPKKTPPPDSVEVSSWYGMASKKGDHIPVRAVMVDDEIIYQKPDAPAEHSRLGQVNIKIGKTNYLVWIELPETK